MLLHVNRIRERGRNMEANTVLEVSLTQLDDGRVNIKCDGPLSQDLIAIFGLLEFTKHNIMHQQTQKQQQQPHIVPGALLRRNGFGG